MQNIDPELAEDECKRITGRTVADWYGEQQNRLLEDVATGKLNPRKWFHLKDMQAFCRRYGIIESELLEIAMIPYDELCQWNRSLPRNYFSQSGRKVETILAFRLSEENGDLFKLYNTTR